MTSRATTLLQSLRAWQHLWRHPALFVLVHGAAETSPPPPALLAALLQAELTDIPAAWEAIIQHDDIGAAQAAYERLAPYLPPGALDDARRGFERRVAKVRARAEPLTGAIRTAVGRSLDEALVIVTVDPVEAERALARADSQAREGEVQALATLKRTFAAGTKNDGNEQAGARLRVALEGADLRSAKILAGQLGIGDASLRSTSPADSWSRDSWIDRHATADLLKWFRDPAFAPARDFTIAALGVRDAVLLDRLSEALESGAEVSQVEAEQILRLAICSLDGDVAPDTRFAPLPDGGGGLWAFNITGAQVESLFPHAADDQSVVVMVPRGPTLDFPSGPPGRRFVAFDLFERWTNLAKPESILMSPRMLIRAIAAADRVEGQRGRVQAFVRLQSGAIAVRPLILNVLGCDDVRCRNLIDMPPHAALSAGDIVQPLALALDLYVDDGDLSALRDACGDQFPLLLEVMSILAESLETLPVTHRRFDALGALLQPDVEDRVKAVVEADLRRRLVGEQLTNAALVLGDVAALLEDHTANDEGLSLAGSELTDALVALRSVGSAEEGHARIAEFLALGLLRTKAERNGTVNSPHILRALPLPGRILLEMDS